MKTAFLFSGQGAQYAGMGKALYESFDICKHTFEEGNNTLGFSISDVCFSDEEKLNLTEFTQPAILTTSVAFFRILSEKGIVADYYAGLSLGEYSALVASGALEFKEAVALVRKRGKWMQEAVPPGVGGMSAVLNLSRPLVVEACNEASAKGIVSPANFNTPGQIVIAGELPALEAAEVLCKEKGAKKIIRLNVSGPFHTKLLAKAAEQLNGALQEIHFHEMEKPVITNLTGKPIERKEDIVEILTQQVMSSVLWEDSIQYLIDQGVTRFVEVGPGKTLVSFVKKINKDVEVYNIEDIATLENVIKIFDKN